MAALSFAEVTKRLIDASMETRVIVTVELSVQDLDSDYLNVLDVAIEEGINNTPLADNGITFIGMSKPVVLDRKDWTV